MNTDVILALIGAGQAITLGYMEVVRRSAKSNCGNKECEKRIKHVVHETPVIIKELPHG